LPESDWWARRAPDRVAAKQKSESNPAKLVKFIPFDPAKKLSEASATDKDGQSLRIVKGA
jgi:H+-transporting ATPase